MFIPQEEYTKILSVLPILCVDLLILFKGKCLLLKRNNEPAKGQYWFPGGRIYKMEIIKEAALRKAKEEVNFDCQFQEIISIEETIYKKNKDMLTDMHTVNLCCKLATDSINEIVLDEQHSDHTWVTLDTAEELNLHSCVMRPLEKVFS